MIETEGWARVGVDGRSPLEVELEADGDGRSPLESRQDTEMEAGGDEQSPPVTGLSTELETGVDGRSPPVTGQEGHEPNELPLTLAREPELDEPQTSSAREQELVRGLCSPLPPSGSDV
ncbi:hypothetical protein Q5P01_009821 [Channa striata]|uniref:Uncharacterized protein n=1 Tax=Channa striata TaxID=64152 RepID=A0AA88SXT8_CHASR|nr:hypothetical protein Q5P01_009821 [Channa striata]